MQLLFVQHATIYTPDTIVEDGSLLVEDGRIGAVGLGDSISPPGASYILDARGRLLVPGFIDVQLNGGFGHDFTRNPESIWDVATLLPRYGVTAFLPTLITSPLDTVSRAQDVMRQGTPAEFRGATPLGLHLEGPFLNPARKGAHNPAYLRQPSLIDIASWSADSHVRLVTLAPELLGALEVTQRLTARGVVVSAGHSLASYDQGVAGIEAGIRYGTHLFNAMTALHHREPGLVAALLADERVVTGFIADGVHIHPTLIKLAGRMAGMRRINLVTDAIEALGMPPGTHRLGDFDVNVDETSARLQDGTLAGSVLPLDAALSNLLWFTECSLQEALQSVTTTPAVRLGFAPRKGQIAPGCDADFVLLAPDYRVEMTVIGGEIVYES